MEEKIIELTASSKEMIESKEQIFFNEEKTDTGRISCEYEDGHLQAKERVLEQLLTSQPSKGIILLMP